MSRSEKGSERVLYIKSELESWVSPPPCCIKKKRKKSIYSIKCGKHIFAHETIPL